MAMSDSGTMQAGEVMVLHDMEARLRHKVVVVAPGFPEAACSDSEWCGSSLDCLITELLEQTQGDAILARVGRRLGAELRQKYDYATPENVDEISADLRRGLAWVAIDVLHGPDCRALMAGDKLTPEQAAFYFADNWWMGRDGRPIEDWADICKVREQLMLDALNVPHHERADVLSFSARFMQQHAGLVREAEFGLHTVGSMKFFTKEVRVAIGDNAVWCGVQYLSAGVLAQLANDPPVH